MTHTTASSVRSVRLDLFTLPQSSPTSRPAGPATGSEVLDRAGGLRHTDRPRQAQVAQLVEQGTENPRVGGSIPPLGTNSAELAVPACPACLKIPWISVPTDALAMQSGRAARTCKSRRLHGAVAVEAR